MQFASVLIVHAAVAVSLVASAAAQQMGDMARLPTGAGLAVMQGSPATGPSTVKMTLPDGYLIALHRHPTDETILVRSGTYIIKYGNSEQTLGAGQRATIKANLLHSERCQGPTVIEVESTGAYGIEYAPKAAAPKIKTDTTP
ncbi:MAG TPA: cupin domain-containing protein [Gemmatimonadaceae bacterium]|nr:cupin domain-containing protein [Gemmatimonadaceae bacterium]